jgi:hypothetical protein
VLLQPNFQLEERFVIFVAELENAIWIDQQHDLHDN